MNDHDEYALPIIPPIPTVEEIEASRKKAQETERQQAAEEQTDISVRYEEMSSRRHLGRRIRGNK